MEFLRSFYRIIKPIRIVGTNNDFSCLTKIGHFNHFRISVIGDNNSISIGADCMLKNTTITLVGNNNRLVIDKNVKFFGPCNIIMENGSTLQIKYKTGIRGVNFVLRDAKIEIGEECMFSYGITVRNHDSHPIIDLNTTNVINPPKDIILHNHVWICQNATILKGCNIGENSIIGFGSVVTKSCGPGSILAGNPAKIIHENINWAY